MAPLTFSDITTAVAFISIIGLIMTYDHITLIKQRLDVLNSRLSNAIRQSEAAENEARSAIEKSNICRKKMAMLEEKLNDYQTALMDEIAEITQRQDLNAAVSHRDKDKNHQGSVSRPLHEVPTSSSRKTDQSYVSRRPTRETILSRDTFSPHRSISAGCVGVEYARGDQTPIPPVLVKEKSDSGKNSMRSVIANLSSKAPWRLKTKEKTAAVRQRISSFHL
ncbi:hypothetical protein PABG_07157 [Paracoccidioides brasiliensis Pb03]|nr:hypothetical protein PABG_07157 [Paracoccidioides brasiliensis Pb03]ODH48456.1 hypothetical protein GX48_05433 [Paracoccidioides brasiliensis]